MIALCVVWRHIETESRFLCTLRIASMILCTARLYMCNIIIMQTPEYYSSPLDGLLCVVSVPPNRSPPPVALFKLSAGDIFYRNLFDVFLKPYFLEAYRPVRKGEGILTDFIM